MCCFWQDCVSDNRSLIYDLIASHGDVEDMVFFAELMRDFERVITHHLQQDDYHSALTVLSKQVRQRGLSPGSLVHLLAGTHGHYIGH